MHTFLTPVSSSNNFLYTLVDEVTYWGSSANISLKLNGTSVPNLLPYNSLYHCI